MMSLEMPVKKRATTALTRIGERIMGTYDGFITIFNKELATKLADSGFWYLKRELNGGQIGYTFEKTEDLLRVLDEISGTGKYNYVEAVEDELLCL